MPGKPSAGRPRCRATTKAGGPCRARAAAGSAYCAAHGGALRRLGAPTRLTEHVADQIAHLISNGITYAVAASSLGIHPSSISEWKRKGDEDLETGTQSVYAYLVEALTRANARSEDYLVTVIQMHAISDWRAAAFLLERRHRERWSRSSSIDVDVSARAAPRTVEPDESARTTILQLLADATRAPAGLDHTETPDAQ